GAVAGLSRSRIATTPQPPEEEAEVVAGRREDGVGGIALAVPEIVPAHTVLCLHVADDGLDGGPPAHLALDLRGDPSPLTSDDDPELVVGRRIVAAITFVDEGALDGVADERFHVGDDRAERMPVIGIAWQRLRVCDELSALGMTQRGRDRHLDTE